MRFSEILAGLVPTQDGCTVTVPEDWQQGRTVFGGMQTALAVAALRKLVAVDVPLRVVQTTFIAPVPAGTITLQTRVLRTGKSAIHTECRIVSGEQTQCLVVAIFGSGRSSVLRRMPAQPAEAQPDRAPKELPYFEGIAPPFTQHFQFRWSEGGFPYTGVKEPRAKIQVRFRDESGLDETHLVALADSIPSPGISMLKQPAMSSSLTWTLELLDQDCAFAPDQFWRLDAEVTAAADGYLAQTVEMWNPQGQLAALSRQSVVVFA